VAIWNGVFGSNWIEFSEILKKEISDEVPPKEIFEVILASHFETLLN